MILEAKIIGQDDWHDYARNVKKLKRGFYICKNANVMCDLKAIKFKSTNLKILSSLKREKKLGFLFFTTARSSRKKGFLCIWN